MSPKERGRKEKTEVDRDVLGISVEESTMNADGDVLGNDPTC